MANFELQPVIMGVQAYLNGAKQVAEMAETKLTRHGSADWVKADLDTPTDHEPGTDEASLSPAGLLAVQIDGPANIRWEKIEALRARIAAGTYRIPSIEVASSMIDTMTR